MSEIRISLSEHDFRELVAGRVICKDVPLAHSARFSFGRVAVTKIALQDIGWDRITKAIMDAMEQTEQQ